MILHVTPTTKKQRAVSNVRLSLSLLSVVVLCSAIIPANAQGAGPDQDSLLPPEVVPLDPSAATKMVQSQAANRASSMNFGSQSVPGLSNGTAPAAIAPSQSAQDFRKAAFDSLMGQTPSQPMSNPNLQMMQGQMGQMPAQSGMMPGQTNPNQMFGQPNQFNQFSTPGMIASQPGPTQSQTLSGAVKSPDVGKPSKLNGLRRGVGLATSFGGAAVTGMGSQQGLYSLGLMGVGLANYGLRNSFTRY